MNLCVRDRNAGSMRRIDVDTEACPVILAAGIAGVWRTQYWLEPSTGASKSKPAMTDKPPFKIPSMAEVRAMPWNGHTVASTFSGCGGSCTGYRMAGFKVVWANEFVPSAQASYKANADPDCILDCRDIKLVKPEEILAATGLKKGELSLFDGSPPCQAFSTAGHREKGWGTDKHYEHGASQKNELLFFEYIRLLRGLMPKTFVAENVTGLTTGTAKGFFLEILQALKESGYRVSCRILDAKWLGVPQSRTRSIFVGVREDLNIEPSHPKPKPYFYSIRDALPGINAVHYGSVAKTKHIDSMVKAGSFGRGRKADMDQPSGAILANAGVVKGVGSSFVSVANGSGKPTRRKFTIDEVKALCSFPADFKLEGSYSQQWERCGNSVPPLMMLAVAAHIRDNILAKVSNNKKKK